MNIVRRQCVAWIATVIGLLSQISTALPQRRAMVSWVVLHNTPHQLTLDKIRDRLGQLYPGRFGVDDDRCFVIDWIHDGEFFIQSTIQGASGTFLFLNVNRPYTRVSPFLKTIDDRSLRETAQRQHCWMSVDLILRHSSSSDEDAYRFIGRALSAFAPNDSAVLVHPERFATMLFTDEVRTKLASGLMP